ncbi:TetR/AcrR family transcriptional regulator [Roseomonas sp. 18066]|uniref:TetR/AcrR family transcriptional regulator n=1 Tax=Roseomonas sp. 18066 TaxID=2681412 RepID=UPI001358FF68|nr:TetR family transcriptional regulator [Roseomonas sp. 18066]
MGRPPSIDRDRVLDIVEAILLKEGTAALTIDAVARAAGISKGGVQSRFGTKGDLIRMMEARWSRDYDAEVAAIAGPSPSPLEAVRAHIAVSLDLDEAGQARAAGMLAALIEARDHIASAKTWYQERFGGLDRQTPAGRRAWLVLMATEGAFMLRAFGFTDPSEAEMRDLIADLHALMEGKI